ncbi:unnamed protein product, partial [Brenthis ino]
MLKISIARFIGNKAICNVRCLSQDRSINFGNETNNEKYKRISDCYAGKSIFVTGGTGFVGKVLIERLLHTCSDIEKIYVLIREKKGQSVDKRLEQMLDIPTFLYFSTVFCNADKSLIDEVIYPRICDEKEVYNFLDTYGDNPKVIKQLLDGQPNRYTLSKSICENFLQDEHKPLPTVIVRPAIAFLLSIHHVTSIWNCSLDSDCSSLRGSICNAGICECRPGSQSVLGGTMCADSVNENCVVNEDCQFPGGVCNINDFRCIETIGGACAQHSDCVIENTVCRNSLRGFTCQCDDEFVESNSLCWPKTIAFKEYRRCTAPTSSHWEMGREKKKKCTRRHNVHSLFLSFHSRWDDNSTRPVRDEAQERQF